MSYENEKEFDAFIASYRLAQQQCGVFPCNEDEELHLRSFAQHMWTEGQKYLKK